MEYSALHVLDLGLCDYVRGVLGGHMLRSNSPDLRFRQQFSRAVPGQLLAYIRSTGNPQLLLNEAELEDLACAVDSLPLDCYRTWVRWEYVHRLHLACLPEIRRLLSGTTAEQFAAACARFVEKLDSEDLPLCRGIAITGDWLRDVRLLKKAVGLVQLLPRPAGRWPTPTRPLLPGEELPQAGGGGTEGGRGGAEDPADSQGAQGGPQGRLQDRDALDSKPVLTPAEAGQLLGMSPKHIIRLIEAHKLPATNVGRGSQKSRYRINRADFDLFMAGREGAAKPSGARKRRLTRPAALESIPDYFDSKHHPRRG